MDGKLAVRNPAWTAATINDWRLCWAELWAAGVSWEWEDDDYAWRPDGDSWGPGVHHICMDVDDPAGLEGYIPLPDTAVLLQLLAGVKSCTVEVSDTCHWLLERLVEARCRVPVRVP